MAHHGRDVSSRFTVTAMTASFWPWRSPLKYRPLSRPWFVCHGRDAPSRLSITAVKERYRPWLSYNGHEASSRPIITGVMVVSRAWWAFFSRPCSPLFQNSKFYFLLYAHSNLIILVIIINKKLNLKIKIYSNIKPSSCLPRSDFFWSLARTLFTQVTAAGSS